MDIVEIIDRILIKPYYNSLLPIQGNLSLFMQTASGNSSDKTAFTKIISKHATSLRKAVENRYLVGDSALFTPDSIKALSSAGSFFIIRVSSQIKLAQESINKASQSKMINLGSGYKAC